MTEVMFGLMKDGIGLGYGMKAVAERFGVHGNTIARVKKCKDWKEYEAWKADAREYSRKYYQGKTEIKVKKPNGKKEKVEKEMEKMKPVNWAAENGKIEFLLEELVSIEGRRLALEEEKLEYRKTHPFRVFDRMGTS
jgi:hypothetical protein